MPTKCLSYTGSMISTLATEPETSVRLADPCSQCAIQIRTTFAIITRLLIFHAMISN